MKCEQTYHGAANQCWIEHQALTHIKEALRITLRWDIPSIGVPRKLSSVSFMLDSFQRHLDRLMKLEEEEGITVTQQAIWYRLHESRWSWKTGRPTNPEGDKDAQEAFKKGG